MSEVDNHYDEIPYPVWSYPRTHPDSIAATAKLLGMSPAPSACCRVLEIACASGGNLIPMDEVLPGSEFIGVDISPCQIDAARATKADLQADNVEFRCMNLCEIGDDFGRFDYIICHGTYSWVDRNTQDHILRVCHERLAPRGVAYVSYNTYPGWRMSQPVRELMRFRSDRFDHPPQRAGEARAILEFASDHSPLKDKIYGQLLQQELKRVRRSDDAYLPHDFLEATNEPVYFHEFIERTSEFDLQYMSEASLADVSM